MGPQLHRTQGDAKEFANLIREAGKVHLTQMNVKSV
jgi:hypothetical protein